MTHDNVTDIVERLREHATDWNGEQMPDLEPAKSDPTAGTLREAASTIATLRKQLENAREALRCLAEGNLGPNKWQADYAKIKEVAREALKGNQ